MIGVVLAGGQGQRLDPVTRVINKHLLPVYDQPMIHYPLRALARAGIDRVVLVTGPEHVAAFESVLGNGAGLGLARLDYAVQPEAGGIAQALACARPCVDPGEPVCVMLGDNLLGQDIGPFADAFARQPHGAKLLLKQVPDPRALGVAVFDHDGTLMRIDEKPADPVGNLAVIGVYFYDHAVFDLCQSLAPSARGELEITDVNNAYLRQGRATWHEIEGWWIDAGTFADLHRAAARIEADRRHDT